MVENTDSTVKHLKFDFYDPLFERNKKFIKH